MTNPINIMLDLETWGTEPGCDIRSIGACVFDPLTGYVAGHDCPVGSRECPTFYVATDNPQRYVPGSYPLRHVPTYPLTRDPATVQWWSEQSAEAQAAFADPVDLKEALQSLDDWVNSLDPELDHHALRLWSHGAHFDGPILAAAYRAVGLSQPWHYRAPRDTRTIFDAAGIDDHSAWLAQTPGPLGIPHHALDDAICQARAVCAAMAQIAGWRQEYDRRYETGDL